MASPDPDKGYTFEFVNNVGDAGEAEPGRDDVAVAQKVRGYGAYSAGLLGPYMVCTCPPPPAAVAPCTSSLFFVIFVEGGKVSGGHREVEQNMIRRAEHSQFLTNRCLFGLFANNAEFHPGKDRPLGPISLSRISFCAD